MTPPFRSWFGRTDLAVAAGVLLLVDVLRVWLPSIITIFGQAASTPAELMGAFALAWFVGAAAAVPLAARLGPPRVALAGAVGLACARLALIFVHGGQPQLYLASAGLLLGLAWLIATAAGGASAGVGVPVGLAASALQHAALGTVDLSWRPWWWAAPIALAECAVLVAATRTARFGTRTGGGWLLVGPALLLGGMYALSPAVAGVAASYGAQGYASTPPLAVPQLAIGLVALAFLAVALVPRLPAALSGPAGRVAAAAALVASAALFAWDFGAPAPLWLALLLGAPSLALALRLASGRAGRRAGYAAAGGMLIFAVAAIAYYAAYDIGYPNRWVPAAVALVAAVSLVRSGAPAPDGPRIGRGGWAAIAAACLLLPLAGTAAPVEASVGKGGSIRLVEYNIRMGFGLDGTYRPAEAARAIAAQHPDVVVLSEVDRAWLLNGGHDDLAVLARILGMRYLFGPAADAVWGDAVLTRLPVGAVESRPLTAAGAPTGAQALGAIVTYGGREIAIVSTHIQPPPDAEPLVQAREIAAFATSFAGGRPTVIAGDLNITPGSTSLGEFEAAGYADGLAPFRPVRTFPADRPAEEIDHVLVRGLTCASVIVGTAVTSDHALVAATCG
ncbi:endonuclease/exonuclease/phosphatase family protein [Dactylosporangium darangshiense]|uniref:Endonuclease/exonuclease/phosphatase domain-containing protein n=1 Tax=Dactylosporangium darangshiense TaxID=579108 RepID=A0ABP8DEC0_9ACTN